MNNEFFDQPVKIPPGLIKTLHSARHVAVLTGAGISAEPAMPTILRRNIYTVVCLDR